MTDISDQTPFLSRRLRDGLERIATALRSERWGALEKTPLNPTQAQILALLCGSGNKPARVSAIARHLGVSPPTATDSIVALEKKKLVSRRPDPSDGRAVGVAATKDGQALAVEIDARTTATDRALATLTKGEQEEFLRLLVKVIRNLQIVGAIEPQRMCVTCRYFRPHAYQDARGPHHCDYVNAPSGAGHLRLDCPEHEPLSADQHEALWIRYVEGLAPRPAPP